MSGLKEVPTEFRISVIRGDGIGSEVVDSALQVLESVGAQYGLSFLFNELPWGCGYFQKHGEMMPSTGLNEISTSDAILLGAVGRPDVPDHISLWGLLIPIRRAFDQYVNLRPIQLLPGVTSPLRDVSQDDLDFVIVRENSEGEYSQVGGRVNAGTPDAFALQESVFTRRGCERILRYAFDLASKRTRKLDIATKSNGIVHTMPFWDEIAIEVSADYPQVDYRLTHVDALAAKFVLDPASLDVVAGSNLFGDILSDLGAAVAGSIGIAPSGNLNPEGKFPSMFEPVHGSAPDIVGKGLANPVGQIWSAAMMLDHLALTEASSKVFSAVRTVMASPDTRTPDVGGTASTGEVTTAIVDAIRG
jgi:tartrate dehydrogenase/decarboxylase/D-malate dehydrogenase